MISAIVAVDNNWGIGFNGDLLEHIPDDLRFFKELTLNNWVVMGRKTWESLPKQPLPNRTNIVITHNPHFSKKANFWTLGQTKLVMKQQKDIDFFVRKDSCGDNCVYYIRDGHDEIYDDRGDLFVALRNVAVNLFPNLEFRGEKYIYNR